MAKKKSKLKKSVDFKKVQLKVGKTLKKQNVTDTKVTTKKLTLFDQTTSGTGSDAETIVTLCHQLGHHNQNARRSALQSIKHLLTHNTGLIMPNLALLVRTVGRALCVADIITSQPHAAMLGSIIWLFGEHVSSREMAPHLNILLAHLSVALTHHDTMVRRNAINTMHNVMHKYQSLCRCNTSLIGMLVSCIGSTAGVQPTNSTKLQRRKELIDFLHSFVDVMLDPSASDSADNKNLPNNTVSISLEDSSTLPTLSFLSTSVLQSPFDLCVFGAHLRSQTLSTQTSVLQTSEHLNTFVKAVLPVLRNMYIDLANADEDAVSSSKLGRVTSDERQKCMLQIVNTLLKLMTQISATLEHSTGGLTGSQQLRQTSKSLLNAKFIGVFKSSATGWQANSKLKRQTEQLESIYQKIHACS